MVMIPVKDIGQVGIVQDLSQHELPINAWSDAENIRFLDGSAYQFLGHGEAYGAPLGTPYHILPVIIGSTRYWLYASLTKIYAVTITAGADVHTNLTRQTAAVDVNYTVTPNAWTSTVLGGIPILNPGNLIDPPQQWNLSLASRFTALSNWPANTYCKSMRSFRNFLVALNVTKAGVNYPYMVKWSHPADPGAVPASWDHTDPTRDAGEFDLADGYDHIVDGLALRDSLIIYKEASVWRLDYTGGAFVHRAQKVLGMSGAMNRNCITEIDGFHVVLTTNDIVIHDGMQSHSILDKRSRRWLFQHIDVDDSDKCFVFKNPFFNEVFICFPEIGYSIPNRAIVYNYVDRTISSRELPDIYHANFGQVDNSLVSTWATDSAPWNSDVSLWDGPDYVPNAARVLMASNDNKLYLLDSSASFNGVLPSASLERRGLSFDAADKIKLVKSIRPRILGNSGETVIVEIGSQNDPWEDPTYYPMTHTIGSTVANNCMISGRYIAVRFRTGSAFSWRLDSYDIEIDQNGDW